MNLRHRAASFALALPLVATAQPVRIHTVIFQQAGFPTVESEPLDSTTLRAAFGKTDTADIAQLKAGDILKQASLLVLPYGSAFPEQAWPAIFHYLQEGGNLLLIGGEPFRVPISAGKNGAFESGPPQDAYSRAIDFRHSYAVPREGQPTTFQWRDGYKFLPKITLQPLSVYAQEGRLNGLGYLDTTDGTHTAAPVIVADHGIGSAMPGSRIVALPFAPAAGFWNSPDGTHLLQAAAHYAQAGATSLQVEAQYSAIRPNEPPQLSVHLRSGSGATSAGRIAVDLCLGETILEQATIPLQANGADAALPFRKALPPGVYSVRATWTPDKSSTPQEFAQNGFIVEDLAALQTGDALSTAGDFLQLGGKPFFPVGTNYFTTEENGWDFSGPRNDAVWEHDFADMQRHAVNFVRTGVWMNSAKFVEPITGSANERFLRNLEAYLAAAHRHGIAVNFTFFAFSPTVSEPPPGGSGVTPPPNPYLDRRTVAAEQAYVASVVERFSKVPWLSYDLINEPSFSNPRQIFQGNIPNNDLAELSAWHAWLKQRYTTVAALAQVWRTTPGQLGEFDAIPLPVKADLVYERYGNERQVRAFDYNLFAQDMFSGWVRGMVQTIRNTGSQQLVNVGQDEGGVTNRVLNQFYATAGVSFTTNHTYWQDDALLWDSVAAKRPGMPNITGETGYQPAWNPDGTWRYDELSGLPIEERKLALGFAAGSSGAMQWDWAREVDFGMQRSDGSAKIWQEVMQRLGNFAQHAAPAATGLTSPQVAIFLTQSLQLSSHNAEALQAQQAAIRTLYQRNRVEAYAVGEYQTETLGTPKLIVLPSAYGLSEHAWQAIEARVRDGAILLASGPFGADEHLHETGREQALGINATLAPLQLRDVTLHTPFGDLPLTYSSSMAITVLDRDRLDGGSDYVERALGKGKILYSALPLELNSNDSTTAKVYAHALQLAGVTPTYTTNTTNPGILICPTRYPQATMYVLTSETDTTSIAFTDKRSGKSFTGKLDAGRAALLLVGEDGQLLANYEWHGNK
jgi:hypothetical protein